MSVSIARFIMNLEGYIDLSQMTNGDTVTLRRYVKIQQNGEYKLHGEETYGGIQAQPIIRFPAMAGLLRHKNNPKTNKRNI
jgi:hypothetical protein